MVPVPLAAPNPAAPRKPRSVPDPATSMIWPSEITLSGVPTPAGQVKVVPPTVAWPPEVSGVGVPSASACAEKLSPVPSKLPGAGFELSVMPTLSKAAASDEYGAPVVGVPVPVAMAKMCIAVVPPAPLRMGSVTDATRLPGSSGTEAKYTLTGWAPMGLLWKFQLDVVVRSWSPTAGLLAYQSATFRLKDLLLPSA